MKHDVEQALHAVALHGAEVRAEASFPADLPVFAGHFPGVPLVPGVYLVEAVRGACARALGRPLRLGEVREARFLGRLLPGETVAIAVRCREEAPGLRADATLVGPRGQVAALRLWLR